MHKLNLPPIYDCSVAVIGLGYVGLPLSIAIANQKFCFISKRKCSRKVIGFDIDTQRIKELKNGFDRNKVYSKELTQNFNKIKFSNKKELLKNADVFIITVPTPIDNNKNPDLSLITSASKLVGESIKKNKNENFNKIIIYESTVYPGVTEEICMPVVENFSGKKFNCLTSKDSFYCGYSPERINPGDTKHNINTIIKVTSGCNKEVSDWVDKFYGSFIKAGTFRTKNIKIAEAAKIIENTQRDINIALVNELSMLFKKMNINTQEVLKAAGSKWNFHQYIPGLVGGHCIGVDPYYLAHKAKEIGFNTKLISAGRSINDFMCEYLVQEIVGNQKKEKENTKKKRILILGLSYKSNCSDTRNSQLINLVEKLKKKNFEVTVVDPLINRKKVYSEKRIKTFSKIPLSKKYLNIIFALDHKEFNNLTLSYLEKLLLKKGRLFDLTNKFFGKNVFHL